jgi:hypothetical protein
MDLEVYCSHVVVKRNNRRHCSGYIAEFLEANDSQAADAEKLAQRLTKDADRIEHMKREPAFLQKQNWYTKGSRLNLPDDMRSYASWLRNTAKEIRGTFSLRDNPGQSIRWVADYIKSVTGDDRFSDLATLVLAGYAAHGIEKDVEASDIRKEVKRARQRMKKQVIENPIRVKYLKKFA